MLPAPSSRSGISSGRLRDSLVRVLSALALSVIAVLLPPAAALGEELPKLRVAVLKYGTANWELELIQREGLDRANGFELVLLQRVSPNASLVALQGGAADVTVSDWLWAARQQRRGRDFRFFPYSTAVGELLVPPSSRASSLEDLAGLSVGVAGGAEDKSWLLFQSFAKRRLDLDLADSVTPRYGAPPLLNGLAETGRLDAVLTYWHYAARLKAQGFRSLLSLDEVLAGLSIKGPVPVLGWVFSGDFADAEPALINAFLRASYAAKHRLLDDDDLWVTLRPLMQAESDAVFAELRAGYRAGVPRRYGEAELKSIRAVASVVEKTLPGRAPEGAGELPERVFWQHFALTNDGQ